MAYYADTLYSSAIAAIDRAKIKAKEALRGQSAGLLREGAADIALNKDKYGNVVGQALENKMKVKFASQLNAKIAGLEQNYLNTIAGLKQKQDEMKMQEKIAKDTADVGMWQKIIGGLGSLAGTYFPPAGIAGAAAGNSAGANMGRVPATNRGY